MKARIRLATGILAALLLLLPSLAAAAGPSDAVVMILTDGKDQKPGYGSGFFISADGYLLTCYHVVMGAANIRVVSSSKRNADPTIVAISPSHDLALLKVSLDRPVPFIPVAETLPASGAALDVWGHPAALTDTRSRFSAHATADTFVQSSRFRDPEKGYPFFSIRDVDLIPLDMTIYNGMSGSPVVSGGRAIGILSGSINEGGSVAWAMPAKYFAAGSMTAVSKSAASFAWPPLTLMAPGWKNLRREAGLHLPLLTALDDYTDLVSRMEPALRAKVEEGSRLFPAMVAQIKGLVDAAALKYSPTSPWERVPGLEAGIEKITNTGDQWADRVEQELDDKFGDALEEAFDRLDTEIDTYFGRQPQTPAVKAQHQRTKQLFTKQMDSVIDIEDKFDAELQPYEEAIDRWDSAETLGELQQALREATELLPVILAKQRPLLDETFNSMRGMQDVIEALFTPPVAAPSR